MAIVKPFKGYRPIPEKVGRIASRPYDVLNSEEARNEVSGNELSFLHVVKPEVDLPEDLNPYDDRVYQKAHENLQQLIGDQVFIQDDKPCYYIYAQTMDGVTQYGLVGCASVQDYMDDVIKKHELTRPDKEEDRMNHVRVTNFNAEPVFFSYPDNDHIDTLVDDVVSRKPVYKFTTDEGFGHELWVVDDPQQVAAIEKIFREEIPVTYVADGHHRTAAAALVGAERKRNNPDHKGDEEYNFFLAVHFPASQLRIIDYNRVVKDLNGHTPDEFLTALNEHFEVVNYGAREYKPQQLHELSMYLEGNWYILRAKPHTYDDNDPIMALDVTVLSDAVLTPLLDITDLRKSKRIDFVGGIRGLNELKRRVDSGEMKVAFALYPVSMTQLMDIADTGNIMPPKTTWFEPKLRSGLVLHSLD
ncbi:MAG: DUF1015 family protein [Bacteroidetes bacterium]|jgi:uncharacterized protein (DUF1015 family)|nr:DUF1015 family protein [Bacteroidota bacterium]